MYLHTCLFIYTPFRISINCGPSRHQLSIFILFILNFAQYITLYTWQQMWTSPKYIWININSGNKKTTKSESVTWRWRFMPWLSTQNVLNNYFWKKWMKRKIINVRARFKGKKKQHLFRFLSSQYTYKMGKLIKSNFHFSKFFPL